MMLINAAVYVLIQMEGNMDRKIVLITGASSGIGKSCAEYLCSKGFWVYGTTRKWSNVSKGKPSNDLISMLHLDVTDKESVSLAVDDIIRNHGHIDIVINNAGIGMAGSIEDSSYEELKFQFDTNFFGAVNVINEVLPHMRKEGRGLIINIGSVASYISIPYQAAYSASKAAMLSMTCSLRNEIRQFGIRVCIVHPGDLKTGFTFNRKTTEKAKTNTVYKKRMEKSIAVMARDEQNGGDPICVAKTVYKIIKKKSPPVSVTVGAKYKVIAVLFRILPAKLREYIVSRLYA